MIAPTNFERGPISEREEVRKRVVLKRENRMKSTTLQNTIYDCLPFGEKNATSVKELKRRFPLVSTDRLAANATALFHGGRCKQIIRHDDECYPSTTHCYYWKEKSRGVSKKKKDISSLQERVYSDLPEDEKIAISSSGVSEQMGHPTYNTGIGATLTFLYFDGRIERKKRGRLFYFWKNPFSEKDVMEKRRKRGGETKKRQKKRAFLIEALPINREEGLSVREIYIRSEGKIPYNTISHELFSLFRERQIDREWDVRAFRYWRVRSNIKEAIESDSKPATIYSGSQDSLLEQYKEDNKKLDERIANIEKQIADIGQKQELHAEMQKREENEKRLAELEEQLHKIAIADTSVKRGILH